MVPAIGKDFATRGLVEDLGDRAICADLDAQEFVFEEDSPVFAPRTALAGSTAQRRPHPGGSEQVVQPSAGTVRLGSLTRSTAVDRLGLERGAVRSGDRTTLAASAARDERARGEPGVGDDQPLVEAEPFAAHREVGERGVAGVVAVRRPRSSGDGVLVDLVDRGAGEDVVELVEKEGLPGGLDLVVWIGETR